MKRNKLFWRGSFTALFLLIFLFLGACSLNINSSKNFNESGKLKVAATIFPLYDIIREVGGEKVEAILVLPPGASPHTFEFTPQQVKNLQGTKLFFTIGANLDNWALNLANTIKDVSLVDMSLAVELKAFSEDEHEDEDHDEDEHEENEYEHDHGDLDPHYWLSPNQAKLMALKVANELSALDQENSDYYLARAEAFITELETKMPTWQEMLNNLENRNLIVFHDAWAYFASDFSLEVVATFEPYPGKSPSPKYLQAINEKVREYQIKNLFIEPQLSVEIAKTLAQDLNLEIRTLDPLGGLDERNSYFSLIEYNIRELAR